MKFWDDELRICSKCKKTVKMPDEVRVVCPHCGSQVWFFNYRSIAPAPDFPKPRSENLWKNPTTTLLLVATALLGFCALFAIASGAMIAAICTLVAIGFAVFAFVRHAEARRIETSLAYLDRLKEYAEIMRERVGELSLRYKYLLRTGDTRIEEYFSEIYFQAELERDHAEKLRDSAKSDREAIRHVEQRIYDMADRLIQDHLKWVSSKLRPDPENYQRNKIQLIRAFDFVEAVGYDLPKDLRKEALVRLKDDYKAKVREQTLKDEQRRIKQQMREEEKVRKEREQALREAEDHERELQNRLEQALSKRQGLHDAEIEELQRQLYEAHASAERAKSMAQLTKAGHIYVLSNIGSFGENIFKVGMTRRVEPEQRVKELGDASVPFPFDVHAMFSCDDAPTLEKMLHHELTRYRVNRVNLRKEYFNVNLDTILDAVRNHHGHVDYVAEPDALEYRESQTISAEDLVEVEAELLEIGADFEDFDD